MTALTTHEPASAAVRVDTKTAVTVDASNGSEAGAFTVRIRDHAHQQVDLNGPREALFRILRTALTTLAGYCSAEHANGYHAHTAEPGCPDCLPDTATAGQHAQPETATPDVVHMLVRIDGYVAVHTLGSSSVDIYEDAAAWDIDHPALGSLGGPGGPEPTFTALTATLATWLNLNQDRVDDAVAPSQPTEHLVVRHGDFAAIGTTGRDVIEIYQDVVVWSDGAGPLDTVAVPRGQAVTADVVSAAARSWWASTDQESTTSPSS